MVTFLIGLTSDSTWSVILGYVLISLEILLVLVKFLQYLVPASSKFGKFLRKLFKGLKFLKKEVGDTQDGDTTPKK